MKIVLALLLFLLVFGAASVFMMPGVEAKNEATLVCMEWGMPYPVDNMIYIGDSTWNGRVCLAWGYDR